MNQHAANQGSGLFPRTQWSLVSRLKGDSPAAEGAMEEICRTYWRPLYVYARRFGLDESEAKDAVQDLFLRLLNGNRIAMADASRGRLRTFLLTVLKNVIAGNRVRSMAVKRGGGEPVMSLDMTDAEGSYIQEAEAHTLTPDEAFDRKWILELLSHAQSRLREAYASEGKADVFDALKPALLDEKHWQGTESAAALLNVSEGAVKVALHRLRNRFRNVLFEAIRDTVDHESEVAGEVSHLLGLFGGSQA